MPKTRKDRNNGYKLSIPCRNHWHRLASSQIKRNMHAYASARQGGIKWYMGTLNNPPKTDEHYKERFLELLRDPANPLVEVVFQRERGTTVHLQVGLRYATVIPWQDAATALGSEKGMRMHIIPGYDWKGLSSYCKKTETRIDGHRPYHYYSKTKDLNYKNARRQRLCKAKE